MRVLTQFTKWFRQQLGMIKDISIAVLVVLVIIFMVSSKCSRDKVEDYAVEVSAVKAEKDMLEKELNSISKVKDSLVIDNKRLKRLIYKSETRTDSINQILTQIIKERDRLKEEMSSVPTDSIYDLLTQIYYLPSGTLKLYKFDEGQVRDIYWVTKDYKLVSKENQNLNQSIDELNFRISLKDSVNYNLITENKYLEDENETLEDMLKRIEKLYSLSEDEIKRLKRQLWIQRVGFIIVAGAIVIVAI